MAKEKENIMKKCRYCRYCYCGDTSDVSGLDCEIITNIKIVDPDKRVEYCKSYKFSLIKFLFGI